MDILQKIVAAVDKILQEAIKFLTITPQSFSNGTSWKYAVKIFGVFKSTGIGLLVCFFLLGVLKTYGSFSEIRRPETYFRISLRFMFSYILVYYGLDLLMMIIDVGQRAALKILNNSGNTSIGIDSMPQEVIDAINNLHIFTDPLTTIVVFIGTLVMLVTALTILLTIFGRFVRVYMHVAVAPLMMSTFAGQSTETVSYSFIKSFIAVCLEVVLLMLSIMLYVILVQNYVTSLELFEDNFMMNWITVNVLNMLLLGAITRTCDNIASKWLRV